MIIFARGVLTQSEMEKVDVHAMLLPGPSLEGGVGGDKNSRQTEAAVGK